MISDALPVETKRLIRRGSVSAREEILVGLFIPILAQAIGRGFGEPRREQEAGS